MSDMNRRLSVMFSFVRIIMCLTLAIVAIRRKICVLYLIWDVKKKRNTHSNRYILDWKVCGSHIVVKIESRHSHLGRMLCILCSIQVTKFTFLLYTLSICHHNTKMKCIDLCNDETAAYTETRWTNEWMGSHTWARARTPIASKLLMTI